MQAQVRGFDGTTVEVASLGPKSILAGADTRAMARIRRFNDDNEIKGVNIEYTEHPHDKNDPPTALSDARRLATEDQVFTIVGDSSTHDATEYLAQQKLLFFGWGQLKNLTGPTVYPIATNRQQQHRNSRFESDGTSWNTLIRYSFSNKTYREKK